MNEFNIFSTTKPLLDFLKEKQENKKFIKSIELGATFLLISFFLFFAIRPTIFIISTLIGENTSKEILSTQMRSKINNIIQAQDNFSKVQENYQIIEDSLPDNPRYSDAIVQVRAAAERSLVTLDKINFDVTNEINKDNLSLHSFSITTSTQSQFSSIVNLLNRLSSNRRLMDLKTINLNNSQNENLTNQVSFNFSTNFFYWNNQK